MTSLAPRAPRSTLAGACGVLFLGSAGLGMGILPTHDARPAPTLPAVKSISVERQVELRWAGTPGDFDAFEPARKVGMIVLAHDSEPGLHVHGQGVGFGRLLVDADGDFMRELPPDGGAGASTRKLIRIRALKSSR